MDRSDCKASCGADPKAVSSTRGEVAPESRASRGGDKLGRHRAPREAGITVNALLPGGATLTGMIPDTFPANTRGTLLDPEIMAPPLPRRINAMVGDAGELRTKAHARGSLALSRYSGRPPMLPLTATGLLGAPALDALIYRRITPRLGRDTATRHTRPQ
ncbi:MAG TPA: hypothetical protein VFN79_11380 [Steroidobacteraceae bacterium]|nr:hypothetical protein [Steroidobacteraceae bacterium]